jgi:hypothetical protein
VGVDAEVTGPELSFESSVDDLNSPTSVSFGEGGCAYIGESAVAGSSFTSLFERCELVCSADI